MIVRRKSLPVVSFDGLRMLDYTAGRDFDASLAVIEVPPGARHAEARSKRSDKYYLVTRGAIHFELDGEAMKLGSGDFCFVRRGRRFSYTNSGSRKATLVLVHTPSFRLSDDVFIRTTE